VGRATIRVRTTIKPLRLVNRLAVMATQRIWKSRRGRDQTLLTKMAQKDITVAMQHPNSLGAGARKREHLSKPDKMKVVMKEFSRGTLHSGSGKIVTNPKQAEAIGYSEAGEKKNDYKKALDSRKKADKFGIGVY
jgi:hypothetical protein